MGQRVKILSGLNVILGAWLIIAPFVLGTENMVGQWNSLVFGAIVLILASIRVANPARVAGLSWFNAILGLWFVITPFVLGVSRATGPKWSYLIAGTAIAVFGAWSALSTPRRTF